MHLLRPIGIIVAILLVAQGLVSPPIYADDHIKVAISAFDPESGSHLNLDDRLYVRIDYRSEIPLRFKISGRWQGVAREVGAVGNPGSLHGTGSGEALAWIGYQNPTHIDAVRVSVFDARWRELDKVTAAIDIRWGENVVEGPRQPAPWVAPLISAERRKKDYVYDPVPKKHGTLFDLLFLISLVSIPLYLFVQVQMLRRYRLRWRELAFLPIIPYLIVLFYTLAGLGVGSDIWIVFVFKYTPMALGYLLFLWFVKRIRGQKGSS